MSKAHTPEFRVAFPAVFTPKRNMNDTKDEYSVVALFPKGADLSKLKAAAQAAVVKKWGPDKKKYPKNLRTPFRNQGDREKTNDEGKLVLPQGYEKGAIYLNLKSEQRPGVVDSQVQDIIDQSEFYGGCYAEATVNAYAYDHKGNRGVAFGLGNLMKTRDGDAFGNRTKAQDDFVAVAGSEESVGSESSDAESVFD